MPSRLPLKAPEHDSDRPRTLSQAKEVIARLKRQLPGTSGEIAGLAAPPIHGSVGTVPPVRAPIPKEYPTGPNRPRPDPSKNPGMPGAASVLSAMPPAVMTRFLEERPTPELKSLLAAETAKGRKEQDDAVIAKLYKELKKR